MKSTSTYLKNLNTGIKLEFTPDPEQFYIRNSGAFNKRELRNQSENHWEQHEVSEISLGVSCKQDLKEDVGAVWEFLQGLSEVENDSVPMLELVMDNVRHNVFVSAYEIVPNAFDRSATASAVNVYFELIIVPPRTEAQSKLEIDWIKLNFVDENSSPVPGVRCQILYANGDFREVASNAKGFIDVQDAKKGSYTLILTNWDNEDVEGKHGVQEPEGKDKIEHEVYQGESLSSIGAMYGVPWKTIWNDPDNKEINKKRKNPDIIYPGDVLVIPQAKKAKFDFSSGSEHEIKVKPPFVDFNLILDESEGPLKNHQCEIDFGNGHILKVTTDSTGELKAKINPSYTRAELRFNHNSKQYVYELEFNHLDPIEEEEGVLQRLNNLGLSFDEKKSNLAGPAAMSYLVLNGEDTSPDFDQDTIDKMKKLYGV